VGASKAIHVRSLTKDQLLKLSPGSLPPEVIISGGNGIARSLPNLLNGATSFHPTNNGTTSFHPTSNGAASFHPTRFHPTSQFSLSSPSGTMNHNQTESDIKLASSSVTISQPQSSRPSSNPTVICNGFPVPNPVPNSCPRPASNLSTSSCNLSTSSCN